MLNYTDSHASEVMASRSKILLRIKRTFLRENMSSFTFTMQQSVAMGIVSHIRVCRRIGSCLSFQSIYTLQLMLPSCVVFCFTRRHYVTKVFFGSRAELNAICRRWWLSVYFFASFHLSHELTELLQRAVSERWHRG